MIGFSAVKIVKARGCGVKSVNTRVCGENVDWVRRTKKEEEIRYLQRKCRLQGHLPVVESGGIGGIAVLFGWMGWMDENVGNGTVRPWWTDVPRRGGKEGLTAPGFIKWAVRMKHGSRTR